MSVLQLASIGFIGAGLLSAAGVIVGASVYDLLQARKKKHLKKLTWRPLVSIVVPTRNSVETIESCLSSLIRSSLRKYEIIIVDHASTDDTKQLVKKFIKSHPKKSIRLVTARKTSGMVALASGLRYTKGEIVVVINAQSKVAKDTLKNTVRQFYINPGLGASKLHNRTDEQQTLASLLKQFEDCARSQALKLRHITKVIRARGTYNIAYRRDALAKALRGNEPPKTYHYASDAVVYTGAPKSFINLIIQRYWHQQFSPISRFNTLAVSLSQLLLLAVPVMLGYFIFLAVTHRSIYLFVLSWLILSVFLLLAIVGDEHLGFKKKMRLILYIPMAFSLFYVATLARFIIVFRLLANSVKRFNKKLQTLAKRLQLQRIVKIYGLK